MPVSTPRILLDVSLTTASRNLIATGIPRVEAEVARALLRRGEAAIGFCRYRVKIRGFQEISPARLRTALDWPRTEPVAHRPATKPSLWRRFWRGLETAWRRYLFPPPNLMRLAPGETYLALGAWWNMLDADQARILRHKEGIRTAVMCHDLIPLLFPEFFDDAVGEEKFRKALPVFSSADVVFCNSETTRQDLVRSLAEAGLAVPAMTVLPLPPGITPELGVPHRPAGIPDGPFVLTVGTINLRKNHTMLWDLWTRLSADPDLRDVPLAVAGAWGEGSAPLRFRLRRDPRLAARIVVLDRATDSELAWLYRHCLFTLYPSYYEGWGLPISESMSFGKLCVASDSSAMPEAGQGLCLHLSPSDPGAWYDAVAGLLREPHRLAAYEARINSDYRAVSWDEVAGAIVEAVRGG